MISGRLQLYGRKGVIQYVCSVAEFQVSRRKASRTGVGKPRMRIPRISLRGSMIALAVLAFVLVAVRGLVAVLWFFGFADGTYYGPNTGLLNEGQAVVLAEDYRAAPAREVIKPTGRTDY